MITIRESDICRAGLATRKAISPFIEHLNIFCDTYEINTHNRVALFLAQCSHESRGFEVLEENLNYSAKRLVEVFPKYFSRKRAEEYAHLPADIANRVYANRMGNGDRFSGDGWNYRGRGLIQLTGKGSYKEFERYKNEEDGNLDDGFYDNGITMNPWLLSTPEFAVESACWYWQNKGLNFLADFQRIDDISASINLGFCGKPGILKKVNGLADRRRLSRKALEVFR